MKTWTRLSSEEANQNYCVPHNIAYDERNQFWGLAPRSDARSNFYLESPWPFVGFVFYEDNPDIATMHIHTIEEEDVDFEGFNPLSDTGGYLNLSRKQLVGLSDITSTAISKMNRTTYNQSRKFEQLGDCLLDTVKIPKYSTSVRICYKQIRNIKTTFQNDVTLLSFSHSKLYPVTKLVFSILSFNYSSLSTPSFSVIHDSFSCITLDYGGFTELINLINEQVDLFAAEVSPEMEQKTKDK